MLKRFIKLLSILCLLAPAAGFAQSDAMEAEKSESKTEFSDILGGKGGYLHPFLSLSFMSTDNVEYASEDEKHDTAYTVSPGIWMAYPASRQQLLNLNASTTAPGGLNSDLDKSETFNRYQTYLLVSGDYERYSDEDDNDLNSSKAEGLFQYNLKGGLSFELVGQYKKTAEPKEETKSTDTDRYTSNLVGLMITYDLGEKFQIRLDGKAYNIEYEESEDDYNDRSDVSTSAYFFYKLTDKTRAFIEYEKVEVNYDENTKSDSTLNQFFAGLTWDATKKTTGKIKIGYGTKDFDDSEVDDATQMLLELTGSYKFTEKTSMNISASQNTHESTESGSDYKEKQSVALGYTQNLNNKIAVMVNLSYDYDNFINDDDSVRKDRTTVWGLTGNYTFTDWLQAAAGYNKAATASDNDNYDADKGTAFVRLTAAF